jgi:acyl-CoA thioester hydrolase
VAESITTLRVRYAETDQMGVVYYANYFVWFEVARTDLLRHQGWSYRAMEASGVVLPVIEADCRYRRPARYDEEMEIRTRARILSPVRMEFRYEVTAKGEPGVVASGRTVHAAIGRDGRPCRLPAQVAQALA